MDPNLLNLAYFLIAGVVLISMVAIIGGFLHTRRERLLDHAERIKALELGREMPDDAATERIQAAFGITPAKDRADDDRSPARKCFSTTLWIAFWGFLAASQAGVVGAGHHVVAIAIAGAVGAVGVAGMICGTILALRAPALPAPAARRPVAFSKAAFDPDGP